MKSALRIVFLMLLAVFVSGAMADGLGDSEFPALRDCHDPELQRGINQMIERLGLKRAVASKQLALAVTDITDLNNPRMASVNGDEMIYAASLPKIAILLAAFVEIDEGRMALTDEIRESLTRMVRFSSNADAAKMTRLVGIERIAEVLTSPRFRLYDPQYNGGLWMGKEYSKAGTWKRDPLHHLSHGATAIQTARFFYLLETGQLVSPQLTQEMKQILSHPGIKHKFVKGLAGRPGVQIYRKSGTWRTWHADGALVEQGGHRYIVVGLAKHPNGGHWLSDIIGPIHDLVLAIDDQQQLALAGNSPASL